MFSINRMYTKTLWIFAAVLCGALLLSGCAPKEQKARAIAVFVPGVMSGSPLYEMLAAGAEEAVAEYNAAQTSPEAKVTLDIVEAGTNQAEWGQKITALAATQSYNLIISSNSSLPEIISPLTEQFPNQKFLILDAYKSGNSNISTVNYNQREQGYITGYAAGLATTASSEILPYANSSKKIALISAQEYPVMNEVILPAFTEGAKAVDPDITVEFRIVGNWYDASKSAEIARALYQNGVDVILPIAGGANQGVISCAKELQFYITYFDDNGYNKAPGFVVSSTGILQKKLAYEKTLEYLNGKLQFGTAETVGVSDGYIEYIAGDSICIETVPEEIRTRLLTVTENIKSGKLKLPMNK